MTPGETTQSPPNGALPVAPISVTIIPTQVELHLEEQQQFTALTSGDPANNVIWTVTPTVGSIANGLYTAPHSVSPTETVRVIVTSKLDPTRSAAAEVKLLKPKLMPSPERIAFGIGLVLFGIILAGLAIVYWPLYDPDVAAAATARDIAGKNFEDKKTLTAKAAQELETATQTQAKDVADKARAVDAAKVAEAAAAKEATEKADLLKLAQTRVNIVGVPPSDNPASMPRELNYLLLALIMGALGSFIHTAKSFSGFAGNRTLVASWAWWYVLHPLIGMTLALIFYVVVRGGFFATGAGPGAVNIYGIAALSGLVGMFSKQATDKLGELFVTLFKTAEDSQQKDKMTPQPAPAPPPGAAAAQAGAQNPAAAPAGHQ